MDSKNDRTRFDTTRVRDDTISEAGPARPNVLLVMADDWGWPHASAYGENWLATPAFDRVANEGVLFNNAFTNSPSCTPARTCVLTGRYPWKTEEGGVLWGAIPGDYLTITEVLDAEGYAIGFTGKGHGPVVDNHAAGRTITYGKRGSNAAGPAFNDQKRRTPARAMNNDDYAANFRQFLNTRTEDQPFYFWYGPKEPHRSYQDNAGRTIGGLDRAAVNVPAFLPDYAAVRDELLDYAFEVQYLDEHLGQMLDELAARGELENTLVIVTGDHGMPFPRAKMNLYEWGTHVPLAVRWGSEVPGGRVVDDLVSFVDFAPTILEALGVEPPADMLLHGESFLEILRAESSGTVDPERGDIILGMDRHSRHDRNEALAAPGAGYPMRGIRTERYLYIRNYRSEWFPYFQKGRTGDFIRANPEQTIPGDGRTFQEVCFGSRPAEELYDITVDDDCLDNLADDPAFADVLVDLRNRLKNTLRNHQDPRQVGFGDIAFGYPYQKDSLDYFPSWLAAAEATLRSDLDGDGMELAVDELLLDNKEIDNCIFEARFETIGGTPHATFCYRRSRELPMVELAEEWTLDPNSNPTWSSDNVTSEVIARNGLAETVKVRLPVDPQPTESVFFRVSTRLDLRNDDD